jgi:hypothetical protein
MRGTGFLMFLTIGALAAALPACGGCALHTMTLPASFVPVDKDYQGTYLVRGVSADGVVVALRREQNPEHGTLEFWTQAVSNRLVTGRSYKAGASEAVKSDAGVPGRLLAFEDQQQGVSYIYIVAVFVQGTDVLVAEAGGKADVVAPRAAEVRKALLSVR